MLRGFGRKKKSPHGVEFLGMAYWYNTAYLEKSLLSVWIQKSLITYMERL